MQIGYKKRRESPEEDMQILICNTCRRRSLTDDRYKGFYHVPNGGKRGKREAGRLKLAGVLKGVPDLVFPLPTETYHGLYLELKVPGGKVSKEQEEIMGLYLDRGYRCEIAWSYDEAIQKIERYMND